MISDFKGEMLWSGMVWCRCGLPHTNTPGLVLIWFFSGEQSIDHNNMIKNVDTCKTFMF